MAANPLLLRAPHWAFGPLALAMIYAIGLAVVVAALGRLTGAAALLDGDSASGLALPAAAATVVTAGLIGPRLRRGETRRLLQPILLTGAAWALIGALWPLSNFIADFLAAGPVQRQMLLALARATLSVPILLGAILGAAGGLASGGLAALLCLTGPNGAPPWRGP